jgi:hypothetical protein
MWPVTSLRQKSPAFAEDAVIAPKATAAPRIATDAVAALKNSLILFASFELVLAPHLNWGFADRCAIAFNQF